jgi:phosphonate transport system substrate-binding protein
MKKNNFIIQISKSRPKSLIFIILISMALSSCSQVNNLEPTLTFVVDTPTTIPPTETATSVADIGTIENPIIIAYIVSGSTENVANQAQDLVNSLEANTGYEIEFKPYNDGLEAINDLRQSKIHFFFIQPLTYLAAAERDLIVPLLVSNHFGLYNYGTQFFVNKDSSFNTYFDEKTNKSTTSAEFALRQFEGKKPCWTEPSSLSGTIVPYGILAMNGVAFLPPAYLQSPTSVIRALYIKGICDFGATYAYSGDPRTSSQVINDLPDVLTQIEIVWQSDAFIPSLGFSASIEVPQHIQTEFKELFINLTETDEGKALVTNALQYDIQGFLAIEDDFYSQLRDHVDAANINPYQHLGY